MLIRAVVTRAPAVIFTAADDCVLWVWLPDRKLDDSINHPVALRKQNEVADNDWYGVELDAGLRIPIFLASGEGLVAMSKDESHLSMSVLPAKAFALGG
jgi:hypothetical protein